MTDAANRIVQKLWSYCNVLRDDGLSYQDYLEPSSASSSWS
jgi:type I restriction enzyme M protein